MGRSVDAGAPGLGTQWQAELRARGYRLTPQRQLVLQAVGEIGHATLELLEELGLVRHTHLGHGAPTYSVAGNDDHVHLVCRDCDAVEEASTELVAGVVERLAAEKGFTVDVGHFALFGRCRACSQG
jgi:Fur family ferric uptake transcriptional regulator